MKTLPKLHSLATEMELRTTDWIFINIWPFCDLHLWSETVSPQIFRNADHFSHKSFYQKITPGTFGWSYGSKLCIFYHNWSCDGSDFDLQIFRNDGHPSNKSSWLTKSCTLHIWMKLWFQNCIFTPLVHVVTLTINMWVSNFWKF